MKLRMLIAAAAVTLGLTAFGGAQAAQQVSIQYDGAALPITGTLREGTTYVPLRRFTQLLGDNQVDWDATQRSATVQGGINATFYLNSSRAWFGGGLQTLTGRSYAVNNTLYVPLRGMAAAMDHHISYDAGQGRVLLSSQSRYEPDEEAVYWLSRIIHAESGGEPYRGKVAVGNVILNRVESPNFPDTIYEVIFDRKNGVQFTPVANGTIYNTPSAESVRAARECLAGSGEAKDCLYFFNPRTATKADWIVNNCTYYTTIGNHAFYRAK